MANSKALLYLGFLFALILLISSEVAATQTSTDEKKVDPNHTGVNDAKYPFDGNDYGNNGGRGSGGRGGRYDPPRGRRCYHGCCRRSNYGGDCLRCCSFAGEAVDAQTDIGKPRN